MLISAVFLLLGSIVPPADSMVRQIADSGRCTTVGEPPDSRVETPRRIAPGPPPILSFRYFEEKKHHRFDNLDLMLDDAGH